MTDKEDKLSPLTEKQKKESRSIIIALVGGVIIVISFIWHILSVILK